VAVQHFQDRVAFEPAQPLDPGREIAIDEECLAARHRVGADDRVLGLRKRFAASVVAKAAAIDRLAIVDRGQPFDELLDRRRQLVIGGIHAGEQRVAALRRDLGQIENAPERRLGIAGHVGMPFLAGDMLRVLVGMDRQDLGVALRRVRRGRVDRQLAEPPAERLVLVVCQRLVAEKHDEVFHQRVVHFLELLIAERP
jgi:hypothetical protein